MARPVLGICKKRLFSIRKRIDEIIFSNAFFLNVIEKYSLFNICVYKMESIYDYCCKKKSVVELIDDKCEYPARILCKDIDSFESQRTKRHALRPSYYIYVSQIIDATIIGNEDIIFSENYCLSDYAAHNIDFLMDYGISDNLLACSNNKAMIRKVRKKKKIKKAITLIKRWSSNNFHFTFESIARLQLVDQISVLRNCPILIDRGAMNNPWNRQLLEFVNKNHHPIIIIKEHEQYEIE